MNKLKKRLVFCFSEILKWKIPSPRNKVWGFTKNVADESERPLNASTKSALVDRVWETISRSMKAKFRS